MSSATTSSAVILIYRSSSRSFRSAAKFRSHLNRSMHPARRTSSEVNAMPLPIFANDHLFYANLILSSEHSDNPGRG